jgi:glycosyltransferase A (GT-A) superfamily protein (DUF2064 family)
MHLTVIAKEPRAGFVKTRLCPPCTPGQAAEVAAAALTETLDAVDEIVVVAADAGYGAIEPVLLFDGDASEWKRPGYTVVAQRGDGLAARLRNAFDELGPGLIVGMEAPAAVWALGGAVPALRAGIDVLGLAVDGGYWMIGLHRVDPAVFDGVPMSTSSTGLAQLARMHALGRQVRMLRMEHDLDTVADLRRIARQAGPARPGGLRETARSVVRQLG